MAANKPGKYIPPHLRGKKSITEENASTISSVITSIAASSYQDYHTESCIPAHIPRIHIENHNAHKIEYAALTCDEFRELKDGNAGRVGLCPWFFKNGEIQFALPMIKVKSDEHNPGLFLSDIGGGLKAKFTPWNGLLDEIHDETPQWEDYLNGLLHDKTIQCCVIVKDDYFPNKSLKENKGHVRFFATIFVRVDPTIINKDTLVLTTEVKDLRIQPMLDFLGYEPSDDFKTKWDDYKQGYNVGTKFIADILQSNALFSPLWMYFRKSLSRAEYDSMLKQIYHKNNIKNKAIYDSSNDDNNDINSNHSLENDVNVAATASSSAMSSKKSRSKSYKKSHTKMYSKTKKNKTRKEHK